MKIVIQRVKKASLLVEQKEKANIQNGLLILIGFEESETEEEMDWVANKIVNLRIFNDEEMKMNLSIKDLDGEILLVSQFTLFASIKKGNRPSFIKAASPISAFNYYQRFVYALEKVFNKKIETGVFGADMEIRQVNNGPVTIIIDSKNIS